MDNNQDGYLITTGSRHYKAFVGPIKTYDIMSAMQFVLLAMNGLRETNTLLDIGCGSLRAGRLFIQYLLPGKYFGVEPEKWLIEEAKKHEMGSQIFKIKQPTIYAGADFNFSCFNKEFDFLIAQSIFTHCTKDQMSKCFLAAGSVMHEKSKFFANFIISDKDYDGQTWAYPYCVGYTMEYIRDMIYGFGLKFEVIVPSLKNPGKAVWFLIHK